METNIVQGSTTAAASAASVTVGALQGVLKQVLVKATTGTTTFDVTLTDINSNIIYTRTGLKGELNETNVGIAVKSDMTLALANASVDESFDYLIAIHE